MKNLIKTSLFLATIALATPSYSMNTTTPVATAAQPMNSDASQLANRLEEINAMDKDGLSRPEKRELRREVRAIKKTQDSGGVYISVGGLLLIIILLIILL
ncbi:MAG: hypothetical protein HOP08_14155 [Cyclobacteriaceae bacterium]|nr:hypothetical protein [Cyclobacteriaceae bacterium]